MTRYYIHDLDDNLHHFHQGMGASFNHAATRAAIEDCGVTLSPAEVEELIQRGHAERNDFTSLLVEQHGVDWDTLHHGYNIRVDRAVIKPLPHLPNCLTALGTDSVHSMLTHSHLCWATDAVAISRIEPWFPEDRIVTLEVYRQPKNIGPRGFHIALERMGNPKPGQDQIIFTDDTLPNLVTAKKMGMQTMWSSHGRALPAEFASYVDFVSDDICAFLQQQAAPARRRRRQPRPSQP